MHGIRIMCDYSKLSHNDREVILYASTSTAICIMALNGVRYHARANQLPGVKVRSCAMLDILCATNFCVRYRSSNSILYAVYSCIQNYLTDF